MGKIQLTGFEADDSSVRCEFDYPRELSGFFYEAEFVTEYDADIGDVPESILVIPWLSNVFPLALATGVDIRLPRLDRRYARALTDAGRALEEMYPRMIEGSTIRCEQLIDNGTEDRPTQRDGDADGRSTALLFSGGIDALDTYYRHREEEPALISIHGFDVDLDDAPAWKDKRRRIEAFADARGLDSFSIEMNMMSFMEDFMLKAHFRRFLQSDWYDAVQQGLGMTGLCAPLAFARGFDTIYMADGASRTYDIKVGNHPKIVDSIAWDGTSVQSDGYEFTRQEKIERIAGFLRENEISPHTCLKSGAGNCGECEKCLRTAFGLVLAGLDPNRYDYRLDDASFEHAREQLETGEWRLGPAKASMWRDLQDHADRNPSDRPSAKEFFDWLADVDVDGLVDDPETLDFRTYRITRNLPPSDTVHSVRRRVLEEIW